VGFRLYNVRGGRRGPGPHPEVYPEMKADARDSAIVWPVFRREDMGPGRKGIIHLQGVGVCSGATSAREMAYRMCSDETYFTFPVPVNTALPEKPWLSKGLVWPKRPANDQPLIGRQVNRERTRVMARKAKA
jgi:hypothetical protein